MLRSIPSRALAQSRHHVHLTSARHLTMAARRPALAPRTVFASSVLGATRNISISNPFKPSPPVNDPLINGQASSSTAVPSSELATPVPSSDFASTPSEPALNAPAHLTSNAPDHQFHSVSSIPSDPSSVLPTAPPPVEAATPTMTDLLVNSGLPLDEILASPQAVHAALKVSDLKLMGLDHGLITTSGWLMDAVVGMHNITGLPWWGSIVALTLTLRMCLFPLLVRTTRHGVRMAAVQPQMQGIMKRMGDAKKAGDAEGQQLAAKNLQALMKKHDVSPLRGLILPLVSMPIFFGLFLGLRRMAELPLPQLHDGGFGWVMDLTMADPLYILPATSIALQIAVLALGTDAPAVSSKRMMGHFRNGMVCLSPLIFYVCSGMPAAVLFYWTTANAFSLFQSWFIRQKPVKRILNIPEHEALPPPPEDAYVNPNPSIKETYQALKDWHQSNMTKFSEQAELQRQQQGRKTPRRDFRSIDPQRPGAEHPMAIQENHKRTRTADFIEAAKEEADRHDRANAPPPTAEQIKAARLELARRKRQQKNQQ